MARRPQGKILRRTATTGVLLLFAAGLAAAAKGTGILFPNWSKPTKGSYSEPAGDVGKKVTADNLWSTETVASAITGEKPIAGKMVTVVGEIIDMSCYLQVGKHGDKHRDCGQKCIANGQPVGLLAEDGTVYMLIDEEHNARRDGLTKFRKQAIELMAYVVTVHGTLTDVDGHKSIYVQGSVVPK
ncbi:MAG TPA: hypothetical protein VKU82_00535 [Planctomycetaceae bacterium]|nr:hypothetical protein [Planctomycetaceae bacterium]